MAFFRFDHAYSKGITEKDYLRLENFGFHVDLSTMVEHPGEQFCRFLKFENGYLEFVQTGNPIRNRIEQMLKPEHLAHIGKPTPIPDPGFSLGIDHDLETIFQRKKEQLRAYDLEFEHKNYKWKENSKDRLPGWNFIRFGKPIIPGIFIWVTEYEKVPGKEGARKEGVPHPNTANKLIGAYWKLDSLARLSPFEEIVGKRAQSTALTLGEDFSIYADTGEGGDPFGGHDFQKEVPFQAVIVKCERLDFFDNHPKIDTISFLGKPAHVIKQHSRAWDIVVKEKAL